MSLPARERPPSAVGPHRRGRGPSTQEPLQPELAFRCRALEEVHAAPDRASGPERHGRALQPRHPAETRPVAHVRSVPRAVRGEPGPAGADAGLGAARTPPGRDGPQPPRNRVHVASAPRAQPRGSPEPRGTAPLRRRHRLRTGRLLVGVRSDERERLEDLRQDAAAIASNVKAGRLREFLESVDEKVLIFTQYLRTLQYLQGVLEADGHRVAAYHGGLSPAAKDAAVRTFRGDADIFLSTEAGGEGRNLQFARTVVNYDLPWNPLRIEQRIGRVHRLGQEHEVHVVNVWAEDTVEANLMELLDRKIHMFELVVGELDLILGNLDERRSFEDLMMDIWVLRQAEDRRSALRRLGDSLVRARAQYEHVKDVNEAVLGGAEEAAST